MRILAYEYNKKYDKLFFIIECGGIIVWSVCIDKYLRLTMPQNATFTYPVVQITPRIYRDLQEALLSLLQDGELRDRIHTEAREKIEKFLKSPSIVKSSLLGANTVPKTGVKVLRSFTSLLNELDTE